MTLWNTLRIAAKAWRRTPALAVVIVLTLALGLGATTTAFTTAYSVLVQQFPFPGADRLVWVTTYDARASDGRDAPIGSNRLPQFADWQEHLTSFAQIGAWAGGAPDVFTVIGAGTPERISGLRVTHELLTMLGAAPVEGRLFHPGDDRPGAPGTVVLSRGYWQRRFGGRRDVIGQSVTVENVPHTIIGVVPVEFPLSGSLFASAPIDVQVALVVVLAVAGGLLFRSLAALTDVDPGFNSRDAMAIRVDPAGRLQTPARLPFFDQVVQAVGAIRGVESAALTIHVPMGDRPSMGWDAIPDGREYNPVTDSAAGRIVSAGYFRTMGIRMIAGRDFDSRDVRPGAFVMAINETFARRIRSEGGDPLGTRFRVLGNVREVVAVVADVKHRRLDGEPGREVYIPMGQAPAFFQSYDLVVRADDPHSLVPAIRAAIWNIDANQALGTPVTLDEYIGRTVRPRRLLTGIVALFAALALLLAACGVYGVVGFRAAQRKKEIAIRIALGAPDWRVTSVVMSDTVKYVGLGLAAGVPLALTSAAAIRSQLFGVEPRDVVTLVTALTVIVFTALVAAYLPARHARQVDPIASLRVE